jgi:hypothetical protein
MLAYVFWHWPNPNLSPAEYESLQQAFHATLAQAASPGFQRSFVFRLEGQAQWLGGAPAYADWYLVEDSAALDPLNVAAVSGVCEHPHAAVAQAMAAGAGSLFALRGGDHAHLADARCATFLTKPRPMPYADFYAQTETLGSSLWRRQMVLGPTPEFVLLTAQRPSVPETFASLTLGLQPVWPASG